MSSFREKNNLLGGNGVTHRVRKTWTKRLFPESHCFSLPQGVTLYQSTTIPPLDECRSLLSGPQASGLALPQGAFNLVESWVMFTCRSSNATCLLKPFNGSCYQRGPTWSVLGLQTTQISPLPPSPSSLCSSHTFLEDPGHSPTSDLSIFRSFSRSLSGSFPPLLLLFFSSHLTFSMRTPLIPYLKCQCHPNRNVISVTLIIESHLMFADLYLLLILNRILEQR